MLEVLSRRGKHAPIYISLIVGLSCLTCRASVGVAQPHYTNPPVSAVRSHAEIVAIAQGGVGGRLGVGVIGRWHGDERNVSGTMACRGCFLGWVSGAPLVG